MQTEEHRRLSEARDGQIHWRKWGPYLSERQWGTVREDYSSDGNAWDYFPHDQARSRAYKWGEDGIAGLCDEKMQLCFALALWNGKDPILKERLFGLTNPEGNHGEDVKEYYFYLDSTPTHSYMKSLYKYPQSAFPYLDLVKTNRARSRYEMEYELLDTGVFESDRYFDVFVEYAKQNADDILIRITVVNRGSEAACCMCYLIFGSATHGGQTAQRKHPSFGPKTAGGVPGIAAWHSDLGVRYLYCEAADELLFTNNETNEKRLWGSSNRSPWVKDGINDYIVNGRQEAVNPERRGTKSAAHYSIQVEPGKSHVIRLRLTEKSPAANHTPFDKSFDETFAKREKEADEFYKSLTPASVGSDQAQIMRQGFAGMLWGKQTYIFDLYRWLGERGANPVLGGNRQARNREWFHMVTEEVISMPDKWEYPWFAAWDLAFHAVALCLIDPDFGLQQLDLMLQERYLHPNGQLPAYEWNFSDVNPPVHAWATVFNFFVSRDVLGEAAVPTLKKCFDKLLLNFTWWVNRKDRHGKNVFEGGFLGLDNIGVFDRSAPLPTGGFLEQADGTAWMTLFSQNMLEMALELALRDPTYEDLAIKFYEHFIWIGSALARVGDGRDEMWDEEDGFFYDVLRLPDGSGQRLRVRSLVGLLPLCAVTVFEDEVIKKLPKFRDRVTWFNQTRPELIREINPPTRNLNGRRMLSVFDDNKLRRVLHRMLDPNEFLSNYGIRSVSRYHLDHPYVFKTGGQEYRVSYLPAESDTGMFGGNSNWRGPIWVPMNVLLIRALLQMYDFYGPDFKVECPTGSGKQMTLFEISKDLASRLISIFQRDEQGRRPVFGGAEKFQTDPFWRDNVLFYEYFHGDNGAGLGASHQTGWTGAVAVLIQLFGVIEAQLPSTRIRESFFAVKGLDHERVGG